MIWWNAAYEKNQYREIPMLSFIALPLRLHQIREHDEEHLFAEGLVWCENMHRYFSAQIICTKMRSFQRTKLWETVSFEKQIMIKDIFTSILFRLKLNCIRSAYRLLRGMFSVLWCDFINKQTFPFFSNSHRTSR